MVQINVSQQLKSIIGTTRNYQINDTVNIAGQDSPVKGEVRLLRTDRGILVQGRLDTEVELSCSRCLNTFRYPLTLNIEEEYLPTIDITSGAVLPLSDDSDSYTISEQNILDLTEAIGQYALMSIPMKPLCREDCAGLCPTCGNDLNNSDCQCPPPMDPRWAKLAELASINIETAGKKKGTK